MWYVYLAFGTVAITNEPLMLGMRNFVWTYIMQELHISCMELMVIITNIEGFMLSQWFTINMDPVSG